MKNLEKPKENQGFLRICFFRTDPAFDPKNFHADNEVLKEIDNGFLEKVTDKKPDAILTDWMMPNMGGLDLCRQLKKKPETADIPVVACTAKDRDVDKMWASKQGVKGYVVKPCTEEEIITAVQAAMA